MNKKRLVMIFAFLLILILPNVLAEFETYGYVRHHIDYSNTSNVELERTSFVRFQRDAFRTAFANEKISFYYSVTDISAFNNQTIPDFGDVDIDRIEVKCEGWMALGTGLFAGFEITDWDDWGNATYELLHQATYDESDSDKSFMLEFNSPPESLIKCTSKTFYQGINGFPERLDTLSPVSFSFILPNYDAEICPEWKAENTFYGKTVTFVLNLVRLNMEIEVTIYWIFKIIVYIGILCLMIYSVVWFYLFLKGLMGKLD